MNPRHQVAAACVLCLSLLAMPSSATASDEASQLWNVAPDSTYGSRAAAAWATATGHGSVIAVIDTGITANADLTGSDTEVVGGNVAAGYDFVSSTNISTDGDGWDGDPTDTGEILDSKGNPIGKSWHGTHVAGIAAALRNGTGVVGVAPDATIVPIRVRGTNWRTDTGNLDEAIRWGAGLPVSGVPTNAKPADVINLSLDIEGTCPAEMQDAIDSAVGVGTAVVVAADNTWTSGEPNTTATRFPANCSNVIRVTASARSGTLETYSNVGTDAFPATIAAPGTVVSTCPAGATNPCNEGQGEAKGTSMSAPHVAATFALLRQVRRDLTVSEMTDLVTTTATPFAEICDRAKCGAGILNSASAVAKAAADSPDQDLTASAPAAVPTTTAVPITPTALPTTPPAPPIAARPSRLRMLASPRVLGTKRVGKLVKATAGSWSPPATTASYQWLRNGKMIKGATRSTYKLTRADRRKKISVRVVVRRFGYFNATASSAGYRVR